MHPPLSTLKRIDLWLGEHMGWVIAAWVTFWLALYASCPNCKPPDLPW